MNEFVAPRLSATTVTDARAASVPMYDRSPTPPIAHLGIGAFARAHLGVYADDLLRQGWPATMRCVSLRNPDAQARLEPQDGLYTVVVREPNRDDAPLRIVGAITAVGTGPTAAIEAIAAPTTSVVTLTVTEKGYEIDPDDLAQPEQPRSTPAVLALALARRRQTGTTAPAVVSLDNLLGNGNVLRERVVEVAERLDPAVSAWIAREVGFPCSVVDRVVPATTDDDLDDVTRRLGLVDLAAVTAEHHRSWVIAADDRLPPLADVGVQVVGDVAPFERRKLWLLNAPHSAFAYCGLVAGCRTIAEATVHAVVASFVRRIVDEILEVADLPPAIEPDAFAADTLRRFRNPTLGHTCVQVGTDGSHKLPQRVLPVVEARHRNGLSTTRFAVVTAAWIAAATGIPVRGAALPPVDDPAADTLRAAAARGDLRRAAGVALDGRCDPSFVVEVADALKRLTRDGVAIFEDSR